MFFILSVWKKKIIKIGLLLARNYRYISGVSIAGILLALKNFASETSMISRVSIIFQFSEKKNPLISGVSIRHPTT